jgi:hypothetical protein
MATNDDWEAGTSAAEITANGLAPTSAKEAAVVQTLAPGAYTVVATGNGNDMPGIGLVEAYDLSPAGNSKLANISTRGSVGTGDDVLIAGFIVGDVANATVVLRALGPSLASAVSEVLSDPSLTVYDGNGVVLARTATGRTIQIC